MLALYRPPRRRARRTAGSPETPAQERHGVAVAKIAVAALGSGLPAQTPPPADAEFLRQGYAQYETLRQSSPYGSLSWSYLGPTNISGRSTDADVADQNGRRRIYAAYATGGVRKTDDDGESWQETRSPTRRPTSSAACKWPRRS
jgi:hypothetical protein